MLRSYLRIAARNILRHKSYAAINIGGLTIGVLCCLLILTYIRYEQSFDTFFPHADRVYRITEYQTFPGKDRQHVAVTAGLMAHTMKQEFPEVEAATRLVEWGKMVLRLGDQSVASEHVVYADSNFFSFFGFRLLSGDPTTALQAPYSIVLSRSFAGRLFGIEDPIGRSLTESHGIPLKVTGVVEDPPENSHIQFDLLMSWSSTTTAATAQYYSWMNNWRTQGTYSYLRLTHQADVEALQKRFPDFVKEHMPERVDSYVLSLQPLLDIHLRSSDLVYDFNAAKGDATTVIVMSWIAIFILLIACVNFMNLATARSMQRAREVGMRKVVGAYRAQLVGQFFAESLLVAVMATGLGLLALEFLLPGFSRLAGRSLSFDIVRDPMLLIGALGIAVLAGLVAGSYPALHLSAFRLADVLKGSTTRGKRGTNLRRALVVLQFAIAVTLIVGTLVIRKQLDYVLHARLGFDKEQLLVIDRPGPKNQFDGVRAELLRNSAIVDVTGSSRVPGRNMPTYTAYPQVGNGDQRWDLPILDVGYHFLDTYRIDLLQGRNFLPQFPADGQKSLIINETMARKLGWQSAVGKQIRLGSPDAPARTVIGVVRDFHVKSLHDEIEPLMLDYDPSSIYYLTARIQPGKIPEALTFIRSVVERVSPGTPFQYSFLDDEFNNMYHSDEQTAEIVGIFSFLAILVAALGLFGLASFTAEQRTKEIGIRKVLGASVSGLVSLLTREFVLLVLIANVIAWPITYLLMSRWLEEFAYRINIGLWSFVLAGVIAILIASATVSYQAIKAALANPVEALRYE
jgi:putative ABC transport system permease protein